MNSYSTIIPVTVALSLKRRSRESRNYEKIITTLFSHRYKHNDINAEWLEPH